jgi:hypothetical protein
MVKDPFSTVLKETVKPETQQKNLVEGMRKLRCGTA